MLVTCTVKNDMMVLAAQYNGCMRIPFLVLCGLPSPWRCFIDGGKTWRKGTGEKYTLPISAANAEIAIPVPQTHELINQTSMTSDSKGRPNNAMARAW
jgi:hypothetical protein